MNRITFSNFLLKHKEYFVISLSDNSKWVLRKGIDPGRYIHFHPARYSPHTFRITANTLKSIIAACIISNESIGLEEINSARKLLGLAVLKKLNRDQGIGKYIQLFTKGICKV